jgi:hypothetical protein
VSGATLAQAATVNTVYWRTELTPPDRSYNWQMTQFAVPDSALAGSRGISVQWTGHGEPTAGYPVKLYLWDFQTSSWSLVSQGEGGTAFTLEHTERQAGVETFCLSCHRAAPPAGSEAATGFVDVSTAWSTDVHGDGSGTGSGGSLKAPYSRGSASIPCTECHDPHGSSNALHIKSTINGTSGINVKSGNSYQQACQACHAGAVSDFHDGACNSCHAELEHGAGPVIDSSTDCAACHKHGRVWVHPSVGCHGCEDPNGSKWRSF